MATIYMTRTYNIWATGNHVGSFTIYFSPAYVVAQVGLNYVSGGGAHKVGIVGYTYRPTPDGPEKSVSYGSWPSWPHTVSRDRMTSVTFGVASGSQQAVTGYGNLYFWG